MKAAVPSAPLKRDYRIILWMIGIHLVALLGVFTFSWHNLLLAIGIYFVTGCLGITLGYHRLLTHRSFKTTKFMERFFATCGMLSMQGSPLEWVGHHRMHHAGSDTPRDPHNARRGFWWSHIGWLFYFQPEFDDMTKIRRFARDIAADPYMRIYESSWNQLILQAAVALLLYACGGFQAVIWGIFVRMVIGYHATWLVNSAAHIWGYRTYEVDDLARNNWWVALVTWGEGWHNNHHAHGELARAGHRWWEFDITFGVIRVLELVGLARDIRVPKPVVAEAAEVPVPLESRA